MPPTSAKGSRLLITGATGVLGSELLAAIRAATISDDTEVVAAGRNRPSDLDPAIRWFDFDVLNPPTTEHINELGPVKRTVVAHIAASITWHRSYQQLRPTNVEGALNVAELTQRTSDQARFIFVSSAYAPSNSDRTQRNAYEQTKYEAERLLKELYCNLKPSTFSCSLVVGRSSDGFVSRYHGLYPLLHVLDVLRPPAVVGDPNIRIDVVPVDWTARELLNMVTTALIGDEPIDVVASLGNRAPTLEELIATIAYHLNRCRESALLDKIETPQVIPMRRFKFLHQAMMAWESSAISRADLKTLKHLMDDYGPYLSDGRRRPTQNVTSPAPLIEEYFARVVEHWFDAQPSHGITPMVRT